MGKYGKSQNEGPYHNNGYQPDPQLSHLDFEPEDPVYYTGYSKNKHKSDIPHNSRGTVVEKDNTNKLKRTSRSVICVDFGDHGIRLVHKNLLQLCDDEHRCLEESLNSYKSQEGFQSYRNDNRGNGVPKEVFESGRKVTKKQLDIETTLENRELHKQFREWRKTFLDEKKEALELKLTEMTNDSKFKKDREERKKAEEMIEGLTDKYTDLNEPVTKHLFMESHDNKKYTNEQLQSMYNVQKEQDKRRIKMLKQNLMNIHITLRGRTKGIHKLTSAIESSSRAFFMNECVSRTDYQNMLHREWNNRPITNIEPSREYVVTPPVESVMDEETKYNAELLQWGLYPQDVDQFKERTIKSKDEFVHKKTKEIKESQDFYKNLITNLLNNDH
jgi:hypothetical protein